MQFGSLTVTLTIWWFALKVYSALTGYTVMFLVGVRGAITFLILHLIEIGAHGFEQIDQKEMDDSIPFVAIPALLASCCNWRVNLVLGAPMTILLSTIATH